ncbi:hypothetical protein [Niabella hibiscisoli]|uniref:hypothetical protein n=1 Tax=Niabella hibiscisoli TaxID=1825928 RepID=UPI001F101621|nr:hypothetical protein [Niabella hibiscisoli]MCH5716671.1 hypothetical protein [Niabella hibiscisoli]
MITEKDFLEKVYSTLKEVERLEKQKSELLSGIEKFKDEQAFQRIYIEQLDQILETQSEVEKIDQKIHYILDDSTELFERIKAAIKWAGNSPVMFSYDSTPLLLKVDENDNLIIENH